MHVGASGRRRRRRPRRPSARADCRRRCRATPPARCRRDRPCRRRCRRLPSGPPSLSVRGSRRSPRTRANECDEQRQRQHPARRRRQTFSGLLELQPTGHSARHDIGHAGERRRGPRLRFSRRRHQEQHGRRARQHDARARSRQSPACAPCSCESWIDLQAALSASVPQSRRAVRALVLVELVLLPDRGKPLDGAEDQAQRRATGGAPRVRAQVGAVARRLAAGRVTVAPVGARRGRRRRRRARGRRRRDRVSAGFGIVGAGGGRRCHRRDDRRGDRLAHEPERSSSRLPPVIATVSDVAT